MYEILTLGIIAYGILITCFAILVRERDELKVSHRSLTEENRLLKVSNKELLAASFELTSKKSLNVNEFGMSKNKYK